MIDLTSYCFLCENREKRREEFIIEVILTLENRNGMLFNHRRLSRDKKVCERILDYSNEKELWMNEYSKKLFTNLTDTKVIRVDEAFLDKAQSVCFVENQDIMPYLPKIDTFILFRWNRDYPADFFFTVDLSQWNLISTEDFEGTSHEKITMEVYEKKS